MWLHDLVCSVQVLKAVMKEFSTVARGEVSDEDLSRAKYSAF